MLASIICRIFLAAFCAAVVPQNKTITDGEYYIVGQYSSDSYYAAAAYGGKGYFMASPVTLKNGKVIGGTKNMVMTLKKVKDGYTIKDARGYYWAANGSAYHIWKITPADDGTVTMYSADGNGKITFKKFQKKFASSSNFGLGSTSFLLIPVGSSATTAKQTTSVSSEQSATSAKQTASVSTEQSTTTAKQTASVSTEQSSTTTASTSSTSSKSSATATATTASSTVTAATTASSTATTATTATTASTATPSSTVSASSTASASSAAPATTATTVAAAKPTGWLELPAASSQSGVKTLKHYATMDGTLQRNYTCLYDASMDASYWVAYPICASHLGAGRKESWGYDPEISSTDQTSVASGYGVSIETTNYPKNSYARGHQIPNADRNGNEEMMAQTYYSTNMTPQIQNGFNGLIWAKLEAAVRSMVPANDTLYVVTGSAFKKVGGNEEISHITNKNDSKVLPVPNYYYKVILKVKRTEGTVTGAEAIGFWLPHDDLKGHNYAEYVTSVDQIEEWTGYNFFVNLSNQLQSVAESNTSLDVFAEF